jgi:hypothetical protein
MGRVQRAEVTAGVGHGQHVVGHAVARPVGQDERGERHAARDRTGPDGFPGGRVQRRHGRRAQVLHDEAAFGELSHTAAWSRGISTSIDDATPVAG